MIGAEHKGRAVDGTRRRSRGVLGGLAVAGAFMAMNAGLVIATAACLIVAAPWIGAWPAAALTAVREETFGAAWPVLAAALGAPLIVLGLTHLSWRAFARARAGRCADFMLLALIAAAALHAVAMGRVAL